jgi:hypothetical protein
MPTQPETREYKIQFCTTYLNQLKDQLDISPDYLIQQWSPSSNLYRLAGEPAPKYKLYGNDLIKEAIKISQKILGNERHRKDSEKKLEQIIYVLKIQKDTYSEQNDQTYTNY